jgi:hypothetical protein
MHFQNLVSTKNLHFSDLTWQIVLTIMPTAIPLVRSLPLPEFFAAVTTQNCAFSKTMAFLAGSKDETEIRSGFNSSKFEQVPVSPRMKSCIPNNGEHTATKFHISRDMPLQPNEGRRRFKRRGSRSASMLSQGATLCLMENLESEEESNSTNEPPVKRARSCDGRTIAYMESSFCFTATQKTLAIIDEKNDESVSSVYKRESPQDIA